jgi:hypothetical protein
MNNRTTTRAWLYRDLIAVSLRTLATKPQRIARIHGGELTEAQLRRAQAAMLEEAQRLEAKAARLLAAREEVEPTTTTEGVCERSVLT